MSKHLRRVMLTGATGFLGSHLLKSLIDKGYEVIALKRSFSNLNRIKQFSDNVQFYDLDREGIEQPFLKHGRIDSIIHVATCYGKKFEKVLELINGNLEFPLKLLEIASVYGTETFYNIDTFFTKAQVLQPYMNSYSLSKRQFVEWGKIFSEQRKIHFINIKLEHMYGPGDSPLKFATWMVHSCLKNSEIVELTYGTQKRDFIYVSDVVDAIILLIGKDEISKHQYQEYELGTGSSVSIKSFCEAVKKLTGADTELSFGAKEFSLDEMMHSVADNSKLLNLGWHPKYDLITGLKEMIKMEKKSLKLEKSRG